MSVKCSIRRRDVQWVKDALGNSQPAWSTEPSLSLIENVAREHLGLTVDTLCSVSPFAQGGFNKLYAVDVPGHAFLMRVSLPVEPRLKTLSDVATIEFVRAHACRSVPHVLAYEADAERSKMGFEWMIVEKLPGHALKDRWNGMDWEAKVTLVKGLVSTLGRLYNRPLSGIGNIYPEASLPTSVPSSPTVGSIVSMLFFWDQHYEQDVSRGPFRTSHDWLAACIEFALNDAGTVLSQPIADGDEDVEDEREEAEETQALADRLVHLLPRIFTPNTPPESTIIHHDDLSFHNLLADEAGQLTGIVDWECVSALPLWRACTLPAFLIGRPRADRPALDEYAKDADGMPNELYSEHLLEWEQTQLRAVFLDEMKCMQPEWVSAHREGVLRNDFYTAVMQCGDELCRRRVREWVDRVEATADEELRGPPGPGYRSLNDELLM